MLDELIDPDGDLRAEWIGTIAYFGRLAVDLALARRWAVLGLILHRRKFLPRELELEGAAELLRRTQREIVQTFRFPPTQAVVNVLAKVPLTSAMSSLLLAELRLLVRDPATIRTLSHLPRINAAVVQVLSDRFGMRLTVAPSLLRELSEHRPSDEHDPSWLEYYGVHGPDETFNLDEPFPWCWAAFIAEVQRVGRAHLPGRLTSIDQVRHVHLRLISLPDQQRGEGRVDLPLPPTGVPGQIESLESAASCIEEGDAMNHCAGQRWPMALDGWAALYRVLPDAAAGVERATLELGPRNRGGTWAIRNLAGVANARVSVQTWQRVEAWLNQQAM